MAKENDRDNHGFDGTFSLFSTSFLLYKIFRCISLLLSHEIHSVFQYVMYVFNQLLVFVLFAQAVMLLI